MRVLNDLIDEIYDGWKEINELTAKQQERTDRLRRLQCQCLYWYQCKE